MGIGNIGLTELIIILLIVILLFGAKKIPELVKSVVSSLKEVRKAVKED